MTEMEMWKLEYNTDDEIKARLMHDLFWKWDHEDDTESDTFDTESDTECPLEEISPELKQRLSETSLKFLKEWGYLK